MISLAVASLILAPTSAPKVTRVKTYDQFRVTAMASAFSGPMIAFATEDNTVRLFDTRAMKTVASLQGHPRTVMAVAFNRTGTLLASGDESARLYLWDTKTGRRIREFPRERGHQRAIIAIAFSPDGARIATVGNDDTIRIWPTSGGNPVGTILGSGANLYGVSFTSSGALLTGTLRDGLRVYEPKNWSHVATVAVPGGQGVNGIAASADGTRAVTAGRDGKLTLVNVPGRARVSSVQAHTDWVIGSALAPNGRLAATSSSDRTVAVWELPSMRKVAVLEDMSAVGSPVVFTGDGRAMAATSTSDALQIYVVDPPQSASKAEPAKRSVRRRR
jgi:WD40 repeat protein